MRRSVTFAAGKGGFDGLYGGGWGTAVVGARDTVRWQSFTKWALSWEYDRNTRRVACRRRVGAGCGGAVGPRANGGSHQRGFWGRRAGGAAGTPVGKQDIEAERYRDIGPKQHGAERHGGRHRECCPTHHQKEGERRGTQTGI